MTQGDEIAPADRLRRVERLFRRGEIRVVRQTRVTGDAVVVLDATLRGQAVVVPSHRVEDLLARHAPVARVGVGLYVPESGTHVKRPGDGGRWRVDGEDLLAGLGAVEPVGAVTLPDGIPLLFQAFEGRLFGNSSNHCGQRVVAAESLPVSDKSPGVAGGRYRSRSEAEAGVGGSRSQRQDLSRDEVDPRVRDCPLPVGFAAGSLPPSLRSGGQRLGGRRVPSPFTSFRGTKVGGPPGPFPLHFVQGTKSGGRGRG